ncbi:diacylglycerol/lipid kinase family protein [Aeromicrobium sp.]|uniref:diacylglycerol/lipid kinase family protein n=1 Tax=Aeromicrobium sp. TaxID=1871063 RepID=UPI003D6B11E3
MTDLIALANADAGSSTEAATAEAVDVLRKRFDVEVVTTSTPDDVRHELEARTDVDTVVVLGGDGSLHAVVAALRDIGRLDSVTLGLVPLGTGNDYARSLDLPLEPAQAAQVVLDGHVEQVDLVIDGDDKVVVNAAHIGIGAEAAAKAKPWKVLGKVGYGIGGLITGFTTHSARVEVYLDGEPLPARDKVLQVAVGNGRFVGGGAEILPKADPTDGVLDVAVSYSVGVWKRLSYAWHLRRGEHPGRDDVVYRNCKSVEVRGEELRCTSDGELTPPAPVHSWRIEPGALRMLTPQS